MKKFIPQKIRNVYHLFQAVLANVIFGFPSRKIKVIGITGTNGKTTTAQMTAKILEEAGHTVAVNSTINFKIGKREWVNKTKFTTVSSFAIQKFIKRAVKEGCEYLVLETSSHSLDQYRVWGINYDVAVITNVTREHLDYHKNMDEYRESKRKLFRNVNTVVVNLDMEKPEYYLNCSAKNTFGYSTKISPLPPTPSPNIGRGQGEGYQKITAENIELGINYSSYKLQAINYKLNLPGLFNIENALAATCVGLSQGISLETISKALEKIKGVPGRMEYVPNNRGLNIIVDYALTPDSLEKLYELILKFKEVGLPKGSPTSNASNPRVISVFGSCGERDRGKRPIMGEIVSRFADYIIVTNEDPYGENPWQIIEEVASGIKNKTENGNFWKILDRREAIKKALLLAKPGDFVVVTGKGAEETMAIGKQRIPWNDKKVILEELGKL